METKTRSKTKLNGLGIMKKLVIEHINKQIHDGLGKFFKLRNEINRCNRIFGETLKISFMSLPNENCLTNWHKSVKFTRYGERNLMSEIL